MMTTRLGETRVDDRARRFAPADDLPRSVDLSEKVGFHIRLDLTQKDASRDRGVATLELLETVTRRGEFGVQAGKVPNLSPHECFCGSSCTLAAITDAPSLCNVGF